LLEGSAVDVSMREPIEDGGVVPLVFVILLLWWALWSLD
jgi:hypothetical protein